MSHQNFQEAIEQLSMNESLSSEEIKGKFNLSEEDMMAMNSYNPLIQSVTPRPAELCCCCCL